MLKVYIIFVATILVTIQQVLAAPSVDSLLVTALQDKPTTTVIVTMKDRTTSVLNQLSTRTFRSRKDRLNAVAESLRRHANRTQVNVLAYLQKEYNQRHTIHFESMWITNQIVVRNANLSLVYKLATFPEIAAITEESIHYLDEHLDLVVYENLTRANPHEIQWGIAKIEADVVWSNGNQGEGVVVATISTGVRYTHEALRENFREDYGWYDPRQKTPLPSDSNGYGTHATGIIVGTVKGIGVAPATKWIACKGCATSACYDSDLLACGQFIACPTRPDGSSSDCSQAPNVVSNSWGGGRGDNTFVDLVQAWRSAGITVLFSVGGSGPSCGSVSSPGDYVNAIGVGSTTSDDNLSPFSGVGPTLVGERIKPDFVAPGSNIVSAYHLSDNAYATLSGTNMACSHAAGAAALVLSANPTLSHDQVKTVLEGGCQPINSGGKMCAGIPDSQYPNYQTGAGRINAQLSVNLARNLLNH